MLGGLGYKQYPEDFSVKIDKDKDVIFKRFHSKLPIETKPEYMTDQFLPYDFRQYNFAEIQLAIQSLSKYVIIPQYSDKFSIYSRNTSIFRQKTIEIW